MSFPIVVLLLADENEEECKTALECLMNSASLNEDKSVEYHIITKELLDSNAPSGVDALTGMARALDKIKTKKAEKKVEKTVKKAIKKMTSGVIDLDEKDAAVEKEKDPIKVLLLREYPVTCEEFDAIIDQKAKFPLLDGIIRIVARGTGDIASSLSGPDSTITKNAKAYLRVESVDMRAMATTPEDDSSPPLATTNIGRYLSNSMHTKGGLWTDVTYDEFDCVMYPEGSPTPVMIETPDMCGMFAGLCNALHERKNAYRQWVADTKVINVDLNQKAIKNAQQAQIEASRGDYTGVWKSESIYANYALKANSLPAQMQSTSGILYSIVQSLSSSPKDALGSSRKHPRKISLRDITLVPEGMGSFALDLESVSEEGMFAGLKRSASDFNDDQANVLIVESGDSCAMRALRNRDYLHDPITTGLLDFESEAIFRAQVPRLIGQGGIPLVPTLSHQERSLQEAEYLTFSSLSIRDIHRYNQLMIFDKMVQNNVPSLKNFTGQQLNSSGVDWSLLRRKFYRSIPGFALPQILAKDLLTEPEIVRQYYPLTDQLLLSFIWVPPNRRVGAKTWNPSESLHMRPTFMEYLVLWERQNFTPRTASGVQTCINVTAAQLERFQQDSTVITPSDKSVCLMKYLKSTKESSLSIYVKDTIVGLRRNGLPTKDATPNGIFFCQPEEDEPRITVSLDTMSPNRFAVKPDKKNTVSLAMTMQDGTVVTISSYGVIKYDFTFPTRKIVYDESIHPFGIEKQRVICAGGTVVRYLYSDTGLLYKELLQPNGTRTILNMIAKIESKTSPVAKKKGKKGTNKPPAETTVSKRRKKTSKQMTDTFLATIIDDAPEEWTYIRLGEDGAVLYFTHVVGEPEDDDNRGTEHPEHFNIRSSTVDAKSNSNVHTYSDGRIITQWDEDGLQQVMYPDGTKITTHANGNVVYIEKDGLPYVEVDCNVDRISRKHAAGLKIPIALSGDSVRSRIALVDGTAVFVKYNTKVTAQYNGSIKLVRRNKEVIVAEDGGIVSYYPSTSWTPQAAKEFYADSKDAPEVVRPSRNSAPEPDTASQSTRGKKTQFQDTSKSIPKSRTQRQTARSTKAMTPKTEEIPIEVLHDPSMPLRNDSDTKYVFNVADLSCFIQDHENNLFNLNLNSPLAPTIQLAGEVDGLRPTAISETNIEPRLYIIDRDANVTEVVRIQDAADDEMIVRSVADAAKYETEAITSSSDLNRAKLHSYFIRKRLNATDRFRFEEVFSSRPWQHRALPAAAELVALKQTPHAVSVFNPAIYELKKLIEYMPLSKEGYAQLAEDLNKWQNWRIHRTIAIEKYVADDPRTPADLKLEKEVTARLKKAYKVAKVLSQKKREKENEGGNHKGANFEELEEIPEFSDEEEEEEEFVEDPEDVEIREAFETYSTRVDDEHVYLPLVHVHEALIQLFNRYISPVEVENVLKQRVLEQGYSEDMQLSILDFRRIYFMFKTNSFDNKPRVSSIVVPPIAITDDLNSLASPTPNYWESDLSRLNTEEEDLSSPSIHMAGSAIHAVRKAQK